MIEPIKFPDPCSTELKAGITAGKMNEVIAWINSQGTHKTREDLARCTHPTPKTLKNGRLWCPDCYRFLKASA